MATFILLEIVLALAVAGSLAADMVRNGRPQFGD